MSLLFIDGFEGRDPQIKYNYAFASYGGYGGGPSSTWVTGRFNGTAYGGFNYAGQGPPYMLKFIPASNRVTVGIAVNCPSPLANLTNMLVLETDNGTTQQLTVSVNGGRFDLKRGATIISSSAGGIIPANSWGYLEVQATVHPTAGQVTVKFNGITIITFSGNTKAGGTNNTIDAVMLYFDASNPIYVDDYYILNDSGTTNTTFLGDVRVQTIVPSGAGTTSQLTPTGTANNWDNVNELPFSTADYNASSTPGQRDTYAMQDVSSSTTNIFGVQPNIVVAKSDAGAASVKPVLRSGGNTYYGSTVSPLSSPSVITLLYDTDPATSSAWTASNINNIETGIEIV